MPFRVIKSTSQELNRVQDEVLRYLRELDLRPGQNGVLLTDQTIYTSDTTINHGLGRKPQGWLVVRKRANEDIWESTASNPRPELGLILKATAQVTVNLWVF